MTGLGSPFIMRRIKDSERGNSTPAERQAKYRRTAQGKATRTKYRHNNSKWATDSAYLSRPFVFMDGEGVTLPDGRHIYTLFSSLADGDVMQYIENPDGLGTGEIFRFILAQKRRTPNGIFTIYGGSYDSNMWLGDLTETELTHVYRSKFATVRGYRIQWRPGKSFYLKDIEADEGVTVDDVVSFFQCAFVKACDDYLGKERFLGRDIIVANKAKRDSFTNADAETVRYYNELELRNGIMLMNELRDRLNRAGLRPTRWNGPGAIAAALLKREHIKDAMAVCPPAVAQAARYAYSGGRFEPPRFGYVIGFAVEYDLNSGYPAALREVPNLNAGTWRYNDGTRPVTAPFSVVHVRSVANDPALPAPLFHRDEKGCITYPMRTTGWYWRPEYDAACEYAAAGYGTIELIEAWEFDEDPGTDHPFAFISALYAKRQALKRIGDGAHVGLKLGYNSIYGKTCQQVGWERTKKGLKTPPFHQLEWAGYITAWCRAQVLRAALTDLSAVIAFETDAVFSMRELPLTVSDELGEWERTEFKELCYVQSGLYFGKLVKPVFDPHTETWSDDINKTRGVDRGSLTLENILPGMACNDADQRIAESSLRRFVGAGIALAQNRFDKWRTWEDLPKKLKLEPQGKRSHFGCEHDTDEQTISFGEWHYTMCPNMGDTHSSEYVVEWINPNPNMTELDEMRREPNEWE